MCKDNEEKKEANWAGSPGQSAMGYKPISEEDYIANRSIKELQDLKEKLLNKLTKIQMAITAINDIRY